MTIFTDSATLSTKTSVSATEIHPSVESATISTKTSISFVDVGSYSESAVVECLTTPDVILEVPTTIHIDVALTGSAIVGYTLTATVSIGISSGGIGGTGGGAVITNPDQPGYVSTYSPTGQWGSFDDDNGVIV